MHGKGRHKEGVIDLGVYLRRARKRLGLTISAVHAGTGLSTGHISRIETGSAKGPPTMRILKKLADFYGVRVSKLLEVARVIPAPLAAIGSGIIEQENKHFEALILAHSGAKEEDIRFLSPGVRRYWMESLCSAMSVTSILDISLDGAEE